MILLPNNIKKSKSFTSKLTLFSLNYPLSYKFIYKLFEYIYVLFVLLTCQDANLLVSSHLSPTLFYYYIIFDKGAWLLCPCP